MPTITKKEFEKLGIHLQNYIQQIREPKYGKENCEFCKKLFTKQHRKDQRFCSDKCRIYAWRKIKCRLG
jgi:hypothetical protein